MLPRTAAGDVGFGRVHAGEGPFGALVEERMGMYPLGFATPRLQNGRWGPTYRLDAMFRTKGSMQRGPPGFPHRLAMTPHYRRMGEGCSAWGVRNAQGEKGTCGGAKGYRRVGFGGGLTVGWRLGWCWGRRLAWWREMGMARECPGAPPGERPGMGAPG